ncbi:hypothetical protein DYH55_20500 [Methylovirgula sp. 4M-Z18]|nr:hypothetical protein DYH55_20500 [Methylovirgula sp. 4M-Z18]
MPIEEMVLMIDLPMKAQESAIPQIECLDSFTIREVTLAQYGVAFDGRRAARPTWSGLWLWFFFNFQ